MTIESALTAALEQREAQRPYDPDTNPLASKTVLDLIGGAGIVKAADHQFAIDPDSESHIAYRAGLRYGKADRSLKRKAANRQRAARKKQFDDIAALPVKPDVDRLTAAWEIVLPLEPIIQRGALAKRHWASRMLGSIADDLPSMVIESMVLVLAKSDRDLGLLARAANELGDQHRKSGRMPGDQISDAERKDRRDMAKARKWLMGLLNNRLMGALVDAYTNQRNLRWDNLDLIATVMASINGPDDDAYIKRHKADRAPAFLGTRMASPGRIDGNLLAAVLGAAITDRGLDRLVELLLDSERVRTDGAFSWADNAQQVFLLSPEGGEYAWSLVVNATAGMANPRDARARAARAHVRNVFAWLPSTVVAARDAFDQQCIERVYLPGSVWALMGSEFEQFGDRHAVEIARPALSYATPQEAARVLTEHLAMLVNGEDVVNSVVFA